MVNIPHSEEDSFYLFSKILMSWISTTFSTYNVASKVDSATTHKLFPKQFTLRNGKVARNIRCDSFFQFYKIYRCKYEKFVPQKANKIQLLTQFGYAKREFLIQNRFILLIGFRCCQGINCMMPSMVPQSQCYS